MTSISVERLGSGQIVCRVDNSYIEDDFIFTCNISSFRDVESAIREAFREKDLLKNASLSDLEQICKILNIDLTLPQQQESST